MVSGRQYLWAAASMSNEVLR